MLKINDILEACEAHGKKSEPDMEVGDLQQLARDLWAILTPDQRSKFSGTVIDWELFIAEWLD